MEYIMIMAGIALIAGVVAYGVGHAFGGKGFTIGLGIIASIAAFFGLGLAQATGYDAIGWAIMLIGVTAPAAAGYTILGLIGWRMGRATPIAA